MGSVGVFVSVFARVDRSDGYPHILQNRPIADTGPVQKLSLGQFSRQCHLLGLRYDTVLYSILFSSHLWRAV